MAIRVNPGFIDELDRYGAEDVQLCYQCGDCSTVCPHADEYYKFPRKSLRQLQMGLEQKIETTLEPWLCYYCGQCSEQCPREADPGETMMSLRRWLIGVYDFTGIARQFFKSKTSEILTIVIIGLLTGGFFLFYGFQHGNIHIYDGKDAFLNSSFIHHFDLSFGLILLVFLLINSVRMWYFTMIKGTPLKIPWWMYLKEIYQLPWHFFTQKRYAECEVKRGHKVYMPWILHLGLMLGYVTMLILVMVFIEQLQYGPEIRWQVHFFGYLASLGLIAGTVYFIRNRFIKNYIQYKKSHSTDWVFVVLLFFIVITGIAQHIFHRTGFYEIANYIYVAHLMFVVPWLFRMPFSKWSHLVYRPLAMYFATIRKETLKRQEKLTNPYALSIK
ncbi:MAG TPA: 4Fe-4S dicluster domain-containing protein [Bacteroidia bacterium]|nr:4Fe-4S dicluster domain-containing protein [Bacteroidia bacterium]HRS58785.1 4Fe-4S dicluster domain-containing protein [Bacteroidia bacterium]HRU68153.1 4Fe-4S dicluster domain-containing protein [Bacteroidia bacterium]